MLFLREWFEKTVRNQGELFFGRQPKTHRIPFGPLAGRKIFIRFSFSPKMFFGVDEPWIAKLAQTHVKPNDVIYDIGAHVGYTCLLFAQRLEGSGFVHAFEILPSIANGFLRKTIMANNFTNIVIHNVGLSDSVRSIELPVGETGMTSVYSSRDQGRQLESCQLISLDEYVLKQGLPDPTIMKIDIEGAEVDCLLGAKRLIGRCFPRMIIEFHTIQLLRKGFSFLDRLGYRLHFSNGELVTLEMLARIKQFYGNVLCLPAAETKHQ